MNVKIELSAHQKFGLVGLIGLIVFFVYLFSRGVKMEDFTTQTAVIVFALILSVGYWTFKPNIDKIRGIKSELDNSQPDYSPFRDKETKIAYHNKLKELMHLVESNVSETYTKTIFESLWNLPPKNKRLILQHLYTDEKYFHKHFMLYSLYRRFVGFANDIERDKQSLVDELNELEKFLQKTSMKYGKEKTWFDIEKLQEILCLPVSILYLHINHRSYPNFEAKIPHGLGVSRKWEAENRVLFEVGKIVLGGTDSDEHFFEIVDKIQKRLDKITEYPNHFTAAYETVTKWLAPAYHQVFDTAIEPMRRGESIIGVCESCIEDFQMSERKKLKKILNEFNSDWNNSEEYNWSEKKSNFSLDTH